MRRAVSLLIGLALLFAVPVSRVSAVIPHYCDPVGQYDSLLFVATDGDTDDTPFEYECQDRSGVGPWPDMDDWNWGNDLGYFTGSDNDKAEGIYIRSISGVKLCVTVFEQAGPPHPSNEDWTYSVIGATGKFINLPASIDNKVSAYEAWPRATTAACLPHTYSWTQP